MELQIKLSALLFGVNESILILKGSCVFSPELVLSFFFFF